VWSLKPERWGSLLVQGEYRGEKACDKRRRRQQQHHNNNSNSNDNNTSLPHC
jgi:hypothetical protein